MELGKALVTLSMIICSAVVYLLSPPLQRLLFTLTFLLILLPMVYFLWNRRGETLLDSTNSIQLPSNLLLTILIFLSSTYLYYHSYNKHIYCDTDTEEGLQCIYCPIGVDEEIKMKIEISGGLKELSKYGIPIINEDIKEKTNKSLFLLTQTYFLVIALTSSISFFIILIWFYMGAYVANRFSISNENIQFRKKMLDLIKDNAMKEALEELSSSQLLSRRIRNTAIGVLIRYRENEESSQAGVITQEQYDVKRNQIAQKVIRLVS